MIVDTEQILSEGTVFRSKQNLWILTILSWGSILHLPMRQMSCGTENSTWQRGEDVLLKKDKAGYAVIKNVSREKPENNNEEYVIAKTSYVYDQKVFVDYPFDMFYMQETQAAKAEEMYRNANITDSLQEQSYALVCIRKGKAIVKDVLIGNKSIQVLVDQKPVR